MSSALRRVRIISYNPMSCNTMERKHDLSYHFSQIHVVAMQGTKIRHPSDTTVGHIFEHLPHHFIIHSGYRTYQPHTNYSTGVSIMFNSSTFSTTHIKAIHTPPNSLLGRCIAVRLKRSALDLLVVSLYFPPRSFRSDQRKKGEKTVDAILAWLRTIMS